MTPYIFLFEIQKHIILLGYETSMNYNHNIPLSRSARVIKDCISYRESCFRACTIVHVPYIFDWSFPWGNHSCCCLFLLGVKRKTAKSFSLHTVIWRNTLFVSTNQDHIRYDSFVLWNFKNVWKEHCFIMKLVCW